MLSGLGEALFYLSSDSGIYGLYLDIAGDGELRAPQAFANDELPQV